MYALLHTYIYTSASMDQRPVLRRMYVCIITYIHIHQRLHGPAASLEPDGYMDASTYIYMIDTHLGLHRPAASLKADGKAHRSGGLMAQIRHMFKTGKLQGAKAPVSLR